MLPLISLILTTHNRAPYLPIAITSIRNQTYPHFELILWDDGSTDDSLTLAQTYAQQDPRIRLFSAPHQGRARSLIAAHAQATGDYIGWVDSDDRLSPTAIAATAAILNHYPNIGMVYTDYRVINEHDQSQGLGSRCRIPYSRNRLLTDFMTFHFRLLRRTAYEQVGGVNASFPCAMDYDLCLKLSEVTKIHHLPQPLYDYRNHRRSISQEQQGLQIACAQRAVENALQRRGMNDQFKLKVSVNSTGMSQFHLQRMCRVTW